MRPPNRRNNTERASLRIRSHSFSGLAPPAYEEVESLPLRATSTLAIPLPSYEEATASQASYLSLQQAGGSQGSLSVSQVEEGPQSTYHPLQQPADNNQSVDFHLEASEGEEDEGTDSEGPTIVIHPREPFLPTVTPASSPSSSSPSRLNGANQPNSPTIQPTPPAAPHFCFKNNKKPLRIFIFITLTSMYGVLLYFYAKPLVLLLDPTDSGDSSTVTFLFLMFSMPVAMLFLNLKYSKLWTGK